MASPTNASSRSPRVRDEPEAKENLTIAYSKFLKESEPPEKEEAGRDMIRAIFGKASIVEKRGNTPISNNGEMSD